MFKVVIFKTWPLQIVNIVRWQRACKKKNKKKKQRLFEVVYVRNRREECWGTDDQRGAVPPTLYSHVSMKRLLTVKLLPVVFVWIKTSELTDKTSYLPQRRAVIDYFLPMPIAFLYFCLVCCGSIFMTLCAVGLSTRRNVCTWLTVTPTVERFLLINPQQKYIIQDDFVDFTRPFTAVHIFSSFNRWVWNFHISFSFFVFNK